MTSKRQPPEVLQIRLWAQGSATLKPLGGSDSDDFNNILADQVTNTLWLAHSDLEARQQQSQAACAALIGIKPTDETEGTLAAQMVATHNAAMECYRRSMLVNQTFEGRREELNQANKLTRSFAALSEALNRHRGKGQQKVTVEHVHVHSGGQAIVGSVNQGGWGVIDGGSTPCTREPGQTLPSEIEAVREAEPSASG
jgi:hypothetical protein